MPNATFQPDWVSPPGETVAHILEERGLSVDEFSNAIAFAPSQIHQLLDGTLAICEDVAVQLAQSLGATPEFWCVREKNYREAVERLEAQVSDDETVAWCRSFPFADMANYGWIRRTQKQTERLSECMRFFGVGDVGSWNEKYRDLTANVAFRTSSTCDSRIPAVATWLRQGELEASQTDRGFWDADSFLALLPQIRKLTRESNPEKFVPFLINICAEAGLSVVVLPTPRGCTASGATRFVNNDHPVSMLSGRHLSDDHFWFTFFHEAGHLVLHSHDRLFIEYDSSPDSDEEHEANAFAQDRLIPEDHREEFLKLKRDTRQVARFAKKIGISPGIVVGQLQHQGILEKHHLNKTKKRYQWDGTRLVAKAR